MHISAGSIAFLGSTTVGFTGGLVVQNAWDSLAVHIPNLQRVGWAPLAASTALGVLVGGVGKYLLDPPKDLKRFRAAYRNLTTNQYHVLKHYEIGVRFQVTLVARRDNGQKAVLKLPRPDSGLEKLSDRSEILRNEYRLLSKLKSPHIVSPIDYFEESGYFIMALEYVEGRTLQEQLDESGPLDLIPTINVAIALAKALREVHAQGYFHGDLSPGNVILHPERIAVLIDFHCSWPSLTLKAEMESWAQMIYKTRGFKKIPPTLEREKAFLAILNIAQSRKYENWDTILQALEALT